MRLATSCGVEVFSTFCESHTPTSRCAVAALFRAALGTGELDDVAARARVHGRLTGADSEDLALLDDLLGIAIPTLFCRRLIPSSGGGD